MSFIGRGVGKVSKAIGLTGLIRKDKPREASEIVMPDEEALKLSARRRHARRASKSGRMSTILDEETLG